MTSSAAGFENAPERRVPVDLVVRGNIPSWLSGVLYRTGPGTTRIPLVGSSDSSKSETYNIQHWFDGLTMHHRFEIFPGGTRVSYRSRKGTEDLENRIANERRYPTVSFGQPIDPCQSIFRKFFTVFQIMGEEARIGKSTPSSANVGVTLAPDMPGINLSHKNETTTNPRYLVSKTDSAALQVIDPESLEPLKLMSYKSIDHRLDGQLSAAHGCRDKETGEFYNYSCKFAGRFPVYKIFKISANGEVDILAEIRDAPASYIHSFAMTTRYIVLCVWQAHITYFGMSVLWNANIAQSINQTFDPKKPTLFYVIDRKNGGVVARYKTSPFFCFHHLNAYDDPKTDDVVIDMSIYPDASIINLLRLDALRDKPLTMGCARRFRLQHISDRSHSDNKNAWMEALVEFTLPQEYCIELPTINPSLYHKPYRFAYGITRVNNGSYHSWADAIVKLDMSSAAAGTADHKIWHSQKDAPSEPIFVPRPGKGGREEDDGVLLSVVLDVEEGRSALVVLDAKDMKEVGRAEMETVFPIGFHGFWSGKSARL